MSLYDLPKNGLILMNSKSDSTITTNIFLAAFKTEKNLIVHHESVGAWIKKFYKFPEQSTTFLPYSAGSFPDIQKHGISRNVFFVDFSIFSRIFSTSEVLRILNTCKKDARVFIPADETTPPSMIKQICSLSSSIYNIRSNQNQPSSFISSTVVFDKKGRITTQEDSITLTENSKPVVKKLKTAECSSVDAIDVKELQSTLDQVSVKEMTEKAAREALELPFISGRQEDGVSIRDASRKKIRVGGQIVYEPDQADDLDDSDPDDDLNI